MNTVKFYAMAALVWLSIIALVALAVVIGCYDWTSFLVNSL